MKTVLSIISAILSLAGSSFIIFMYLRFKDIRSFPFKLLTYLSTADLFAAISHFVPSCFLSAVMQEFFFTASFFWVLVISLHSYIFVVKRLKAATKYEIFYHLGSWGIPLLFTLICIFYDAFGPTDSPWCWIDSEFVALRWLLFYIPLIMIMIILCYFTFQITRVLKAKGQDIKLDSTSSNLDKQAASLTIYVIAFVIVRTPSVITRTMGLFTSDNIILSFLSHLHALCSPLQGFVNSLLVLSNPRVRQHVFNKQVRIATQSQRLNPLQIANVSYSITAPPQFVGMGHSTPSDQLTLRIVTFNGGKAPIQREDVLNLVGSDPNHILVLGFQEMEQSLEEIVSYIPQHWGMRIVGSEQLWGIKMVVLVENSLINHVSDVSTDKVSTGKANNLLGNKGAVGVSLKVYSGTLAFVCCHLAARPERNNQRFENIGRIFKCLNLNSNTGVRGVPLDTKFDCLFVLGDLNFRVNVPYDQAVQYANTNAFGALLANDQLKLAIDRNQALTSFEESCITFKPTYKHEVSHGESTQRKYFNKDNQSPSYTDRVLFSQIRNVQIVQREYSSITMPTSDHNAVAFDCDVGVLCPATKSLHYPCLADIQNVGFNEPIVCSGVPNIALEFIADFILKRASTPSKLTSCPSWSNDEMPRVVINGMTPYLLAAKSITVVVRDTNAAVGENAILGTASIPMLECCKKARLGSRGQLIEFSIPVMNAGVAVGMLRISVSLYFFRETSSLNAPQMQANMNLSPQLKRLSSRL
ncbi:hypothetical protein PCE1_003330 [Barthelona sp. PCE]